MMIERRRRRRRRRSSSSSSSEERRARRRRRSVRVNVVDDDEEEVIERAGTRAQGVGFCDQKEEPLMNDEPLPVTPLGSSLYPHPCSGYPSLGYVMATNHGAARGGRWEGLPVRSSRAKATCRQTRVPRHLLRGGMKLSGYWLVGEPLGLLK
jgi:hypothetical protein